ncbi:MAG TPA: hypothetical protein VLT47_04720 [Anaeromyxobacteraceae bacterium]|nr:hypothetical protein [Anaeromyxobacteraceae bacterium]
MSPLLLLLAAPLLAVEPATPAAVSAPVAAEPVASPQPVEVAPEPVPAEPPLVFRGHLEWITAAGAASSRATPVDPGNGILRVPAGGGQTELRPDLRLEVGPALTAIARPRFWLRSEKAHTDGGWLAERSEAKAEWIEGYAAWRVSDRLAVAYGLQNFQWGPAELVSPSNRIFHATGFYRDPVYVVRGRHLARANVSSGRAWSAVLLAEVGENGEAPFVAGEPFERKAQAKLEWTAPAGDLYAAVTAGAAERSRGWFGEYATVPLVAGLAVYVDAVHTVGRRAWYPVPDPALGVGFAQTGMETRALRTTALGGLRYSFESGDDLRVEYLFDEAGWTDAQLDAAQTAAIASLVAHDPAGLQRFVDPGFELLGRHLLYVSLSLPDLPPAERTRVQARYLYSLTDRSGAAFLTASHDATDAVVVFVSLSATHGPPGGALSRFTRGAATAGAIVNW